jgi:hypothetical protein
LLPHRSGYTHAQQVCGKDFGLAKNCDLVVVKVPFGVSLRIWPNAFAAVKNDIQTHQIKKAVISMSLFWPSSEVDEMSR